MLLGAVVLLTVFFLIFGETLALAVVGWQFKGYCERELGKKVSYESVSIYDEEIVFSGVHFVGVDAALGRRPFLKVGRMRMEYDFDVLQWKLEIHIIMEDATFLVMRDGKRSRILEATLERLLDAKGYPLKDWELIYGVGSKNKTWRDVLFPVLSTSCELRDAVVKVPGAHLFNFDWLPISGQRYGRSVKLRFDDSGGYFAADIVVEASGLRVDLISENLEAAGVSKAYNLLKHVYSPGKRGLLARWTVHRGKLQGKGAVHIPKQGNPYAEGKYTISDIEVALPYLSLEAKIPEIAVQLKKGTGTLFHTLSGMRERSVWERLGLGTEGIAKFMEVASLRCAKHGQLLWELEKLGGAVSLGSGGRSSLMLAGALKWEGKASLLKVYGGGLLFEEQPYFEAELNLNDNDQDETIAKLRWERETPYAEVVDIALRDLSAGALNLWKELCEDDYPKLELCQITSGTLSLDAKLTIGPQGLSQVSFKDIVVQNASCRVFPSLLYVEAADVRGSLSLDVSTPNVWSTIDADIDVEGGLLRPLLRFEERWVLKDLGSSLHLRRGLFKSSYLRGRSLGLECRVDIDGFSTHGLAQFEASGKLDGLLPLLPERVARGLTRAFSEDVATRFEGLGWRVDQ